MNLKDKDFLIPLAAVAAAATGGMLGLTSYATSMIVMWSVFAIAILGLDLLFGRCGETSLAQAMVLGVGAYVTAKFSANPIIAIAIAVGIGGAVGFILALPAMRADGPYLTLATLSAGSLGMVVWSQSEWTGGEVGIQVEPLKGILWFALGLLFLAVVVSHWITESKTGRAFEALRDSPVATDQLAIGVGRYKAVSFALAGAFGSLGGSLLAFSQGIVAPGYFNFEQSIMLLLGVMIGGRRSKTGSLIGAAVVVGLPLWLSQYGEWSSLIFGVIILLAVNFLHDGVSGLFKLHVSKAPVRKDTVSSAITPQLANGVETVLQVKNIDVSFGAFSALKNISFEVKAGECLGLIGPNGAGKSTLINVIAGLYLPAAGSIERTGHFGRTFQNLEVFSDMLVIDNVLTGMHNSASDDKTARAYALLDLVGLTDHAGDRANDLSYANRRMLEIARALATDPSLLLLDEPAAGMRGDDLLRLNSIVEQVKKAGISVILIDHNLDIVFRNAGRVQVLDAGESLALGKPDEIKQNKAVMAAYLGEAAC